MNHIIEAIAITTVTALLLIRWWYVAKEAKSRKYIFLLGICVLTGGMSYIIATSYDILFLGLIALVAYPTGIYLFIRAALSEHRTKNKISDE